MFCIVAWEGGYNEPCVKNLESCVTQRSWAIVPSPMVNCDVHFKMSRNKKWH